jgi:glycerophosphoryl diester phosphodiesterase
VISFDPGTIESVRKLDASIMTGLLIEEGGQTDAVKKALDIGARQLCPRNSLITSELIAEAHRADLLVATWTVDDADEMRRVIAAGADGVMTDFPDRLMAIVEDS